MAKQAVYIEEKDFDWVVNHWWEYPQWHDKEVRVQDYNHGYDYTGGVQGDGYVGKTINDGKLGYSNGNQPSILTTTGVNTAALVTTAKTNFVPILVIVAIILAAYKFFK